MGIYNELSKLSEQSPPSEAVRTPVKKQESPPSRPSRTPSNRDTTTPRNHDTTVSRYHDAIIELVRKAVKEFGKEAATHRFTVEEKRAIADLVYSYGRQGIRTSENEITRIAVNFVIGNFREDGKNSVLDKALRALNG